MLDSVTNDLENSAAIFSTVQALIRVLTGQGALSWVDFTILLSKIMSLTVHTMLQLLSYIPKVTQDIPRKITDAEPLSATI